MNGAPGGRHVTDYLLFGKVHAEEERQAIPERNQLAVALDEIIRAPRRIVNIVQERSPYRRLEPLLFFEEFCNSAAGLGRLTDRMLLAKIREMQRHEQRRVTAKTHHLADAFGPDVQVSRSWHLQKCLRESALAVEHRRLLPLDETDIMLLRRETHFLLGRKTSKHLVAPSPCQLAGNPGMSRLADHNQTLFVLPMKHGMELDS